MESYMTHFNTNNDVNITVNTPDTYSSIKSSIPALILYVLGFIGFGIMMFNMSGGLILLGIFGLIFYILPVLAVLFTLLLKQFEPKSSNPKANKPFITELIQLLYADGNVIKNILNNFIAPYAFLLFDLFLAVFWICYPIGIIKEATLIGLVIPSAYCMYYYPFVLIKAAVQRRSKTLIFVMAGIVVVSLTVFLVNYNTFAETGSVAGIALFFTMLTVLSSLAILITNLVLSKPKLKPALLLTVYSILAIAVCASSLYVLPGLNADKYEQAIACVQNGEYRQARELFLQLGRYEDSAEQYEKIKFVKLEVGEKVVMGSQATKPDSSTGDNPLSWTVIAVENGKALLFSDAILTSIDSNSLSKWNESNNVRNKLGDLMYVFNDHEKARIAEYSYSFAVNGETMEAKDKLFLLSREELEKYCSTEQIFSKKDTSYNDHQVVGFGFDYDYVYSYYVRDTDDSGEWIMVSCEEKQFTDKNTKYVGIRPAMYVSLDEQP